MRFRYRIHAARARHVKIAPESCDRDMREFWRELARPVTFFDMCSPYDLLVDRNRRIL